MTNLRPTFWQSTLAAFEGNQVKIGLRAVQGENVRRMAIGEWAEVGPTFGLFRLVDGSTVTIDYADLLECSLWGVHK